MWRRDCCGIWRQRQKLRAFGFHLWSGRLAEAAGKYAFRPLVLVSIPFIVIAAFVLVEFVGWRGWGCFDEPRNTATLRGNRAGLNRTVGRQVMSLLAASLRGEAGGGGDRGNHGNS